MISFELSDTQRLARDAAREFARRELRARARQCDEESRCPAALLDQGWTLGLVTACIPEALGGGGITGGQTTSAVVLEELGYGCASLAAMVMAPMLFVRPMVDFGTDEQRGTYLPPAGPPVPRGDSRMKGPASPSITCDVGATSVLSGYGYLLRGEKGLVPMGDRASHFLVIARGERGPGLANLEAFIVPRDAPGLRVDTDAEKTIGFQAMPWGRLSLAAVKVPVEGRLGGERGIDGRRLISTLRVGGAALSVGLARAVTETCVAYAKDRVAFGLPIARKQAIAFMVADMHTEVEAMRWLVWKAASLLEQGEDATRAAVLAQDYVARKTMKIADDGIQVLGGHGFIRDYPMEMWFRNARLVSVHEGPVAV